MNPAARVALVAAAEARAAMVPDHMQRARGACERLLRAGVVPAVTGSLAGFLWGCTRRPADVDLEVSREALVGALHWHVGPAAVHALPSCDVVFASQGFLGDLGVDRDGPTVDLVVVPTSCAPEAWLWVGGLPVVPPGWLAFRKALRLAAVVHGGYGGRTPERDPADVAELVGVPGLGAQMPQHPRGVGAVVAAILAGEDYTPAARSIDPAELAATLGWWEPPAVAA